MYLEEFTDFITFEKRYSHHTSIAYKTDLSQFLDWLKENQQQASIKSLNHIQIRAWIVHLINNGNSPKSVNRKITCLKTYFKFLLRGGFIDVNPMLKIQVLKQDKKLPVFVPEQKIKDLLEHINFGDDFEGIRNKLIISLFYATGIRVSELITLKKTQVNLYNQNITVIGKRNKERLIPVIPEISKQMEHYLNFISESSIPLSEFIFISEKGKKLSPQKVYSIVKQSLSAVTTSGKKSLHVLSHTFATHMLNNGADINAIKEILGHASLSATQVYTHNSIEKLKKSYKIAHPKA